MDPHMRRQMGKVIRTGRLARGISQVALARYIEDRLDNDETVSQAAVSQWERGETAPSWPKLRALADILDLNPAILEAMKEGYREGLSEARRAEIAAYSGDLSEVRIDELTREVRELKELVRELAARVMQDDDS